MKKRPFFLLLIFLLLALNVKAQAVVSGKVLDENNKTLRGATIMISQDSTSAILA